MESPLVSLEHVSHSFDDGRIVALRDVDLTIGEGESVAIVGASGSGKSTLILLMCGIRVPVKGRLLWRGTPVTRPEQWTELRRTEIGIVFQEFNLFATLTALENIEVAMFGTGLGRHERRRRSDAVLETVGLSKRATHLPHELSGGERQRVAIARSIINNPKLILADEPTGNLDSANAKSILDLLFELRENRGATLVMVSHEPSYARRCVRQIKIKDGQVYEKAGEQAVRRAI
jgi:ABC-type lipoprotein export system ATPase subunit